MNNLQILHGDIAFSAEPDSLSVYEDSYIVVDNGIVSGIYKQIPEQYANIMVTDYGRGLIIPAFSDMHIHAPQLMQRGTGMDMLLYDWLNSYTFPEEAKFSDAEYAALIYNALADEMIKNGSFHACVFSTIHTDSAILLSQILEKRGIHAFVGKVNMDVNSPDYLCESTRQSLSETERFLSSFSRNSSVKPILTPRFAPTCSLNLLKGLGKLAEKHCCGLHTHIVESRWEAAEAVRLFPDCSCDTEIYEKTGLLDNGPNIFAHFIFPSENDICLAEKHNAVTVHCPDATNNIIAGIMPVSQISDKEIPVAIGTDVGAGSRMSVFSQVARTVQLSKLRDFYCGDSSPVSFSRAFYMATKEGGKVFGKYGSFEKGYVFDAIVIDNLEDCSVRLSPENRLERFCYNGDDRNITARYISGRKI